MPKRNLTLAPRKENVRDKKPARSTRVVIFDPDTIFRHFEETLTSISNLFPVAHALAQSGKFEERDNTWRAQIVFLAGAFDFFMHEITKYGLKQILCGEWEQTTKYKNLPIKMETVHRGLRADADDMAWFYDYVNTYYSACTMISHTEVKKQFSLLGMDLTVLAQKAFYKQGDKKPESEKLKESLDQLFDRRNLIAHQVDRAHANASVLPIDEPTVQNFIADIEIIVKAIHEIAKEKDCAAE